MEVPRVPQIVSDILQTPNVFDLPPHERAAGRVNMYMQVSSWFAVANEMTECGLIELIREGSCRVVERAGAFGVPKRVGEPARVINFRSPAAQRSPV
eukprot:1697940-Amphidinium_carterae.1